MESPDVRGTAVPLNSDTETPACQSCRSRKLRCSRDLPSCTRCQRLGVDCYYDYTKNKPGVKVGIIQTLTQRVESLEAQLEALRTQHQAVSGIPSPASTVQDVNALRTLVSSMMEEWRENNTSPNNMSDQRLNSPQDRDVHDSTVSGSSPETSRKRPCPDSRSSVDPTFQVQLPPDNLMSGILDAYFSVVHPFIPILHEPLFRSRLRDPAERPKLMPILHAMMVCSLRTSHPGALQKSRDFVVLSSIDSLSVEGAQSLVIIAFVHICDGNASKAWPIVGALTRAVVYMGLHCEPDEDQQGDSCVQSFRYLPSVRVWTEMEERRRVFWNVFLLDRWKMFLPRRWKDSNISKEPAFVHMDPNLTLAHITHNTSMILLHQCIAYPRANLVDKLKQASISSAETCQLAASETANIVQKYLQYTPFVGLVNAQFVFCAFVSARVMLVHSHLHRTELPEGYSVLLWSLQQMSARWVSSNPNLRLTLKTDNFASGLLSQLQKLQERCKYVEPFELDALGYAIEVSFALGIRSPPASLGESQWIRERRAQQRHSIIPVNGQRSHYMNSSPCAHRSDQCSDHDHASQPVVAPSVNVTPSGPQVASDATIRDMGQWNGNQISNQQRMDTLRTRDAYATQTGPVDGLFPSASAASPLDGSDSFAALSNFLLDPQYLDMDRIISFQDSFTH
ncbi:fungal-specific transcription factor domain-containing protein [Aspergillus pseudonomiae]|uniref:Fungal-specific transcription factor domain-containing protein n=1 Tax=Aspergillus pseudonomiae TaxID=1506151 RepID=A0A5N7CWC8_9EURO|nr:fungal-specific transcription factor domain-containing protein [Aspergillus pseudonomiae]KAB8255029.1 fungal-specific transcription factor domain-containing protein [Aspergillus pseudonomiae]KAE8398471.1 fungal-specific transcription factor domain-containing protein [Aspergillus pseudonomiae]